jgi:hypothetical protein
MNGTLWKLAGAIAVALLVVPASFAQQSFLARCAEPVGIRHDQVDGQIRSQPDGFSGVTPIFMFSSETPSRLNFVWGPAAWARDELRLRQNLQSAVIVQMSPEKITAVRVEDGGVAQMYSVYPSRRLVFFTQHRLIAPHLGGVPSTATFHTACEFLPLR